MRIPVCSLMRVQSEIIALTQAKLFERAGTELQRDSPNVGEALLDNPSHLGELGMLVPHVLRRVLGPQRHRSQRLAKLIVQLARDPEPLSFLSGKDAPGALAPLGLESFEHLVERLRERQHLSARAFEAGGALPGTQQIHLLA